MEVLIRANNIFHEVENVVNNLSISPQTTLEEDWLQVLNFNWSNSFFFKFSVAHLHDIRPLFAIARGQSLSNKISRMTSLITVSGFVGSYFENTFKTLFILQNWYEMSKYLEDPEPSDPPSSPDPLRRGSHWRDSIDSDSTNTDSETESVIHHPIGESVNNISTNNNSLPKMKQVHILHREVPSSQSWPRSYTSPVIRIIALDSQHQPTKAQNVFIPSPAKTSLNLTGNGNSFALAPISCADELTDALKKRVHKCHFPNCEKMYTKSSHLKAHQRTHTGIVCIQL